MVVFEYWVLNYNFNTKSIEYYNIFDNISVLECTNDLCKQYKRKKMTFDEFVEELRKTIAWQEWSRVEYEISVGAPFENDYEKLEKWDAYQQALPNIRLIAMYCLQKYYPRLKIKDKGGRK